VNTTNILHSYRNGNVDITLYDDGTKVLESSEIFNYEYPSSVDMKITDWCALGCVFCHESSTTNGAEGDYDFMIQSLKQLPRGTEIALGGGETLSYSRIIDLLREMKNLGLVANITTNQGNLKTYYPLLERIIDEDLVYGIGISITSNNYTYIKKVTEKSSNVVFNIIAGIHNPSVIDEIASHVENPKFALLGYKTHGFGKSYRNISVDRSIKQWYMYTPTYFGKYMISFDNLSIEQLNMKRMFTDSAWDKYYIGDEGSHSMYIDSINKSYAINSRTDKEFHKKDISIKDFFDSIK
jgi:hypothetical protein